MAVKIQLRRDTATNWSTINPVLAKGEPGYETDTGKLKFGDGLLNWNSLSYFADGASLTIEDVEDTLANSFLVGGSGVALSYNDGGDTLTINVTEAPRLATTVFNSTGSPISKFRAVYINGGQGDQPTIALAVASGEMTSSKTYGITAEAISNMSTGKVVVFGALTGVNTDQFNPTAPTGNVNGTTLYLSATTPGGLTTTKPSAPDNMVAVGTIVRTHQNEGVVEVRIQNGFELEELHNVSVSGVTDGQFLQYDSDTQLWVAASINNFVSLAKDSYVICEAGDNLPAKYTAAKALTPNGSAKSNTNRATLIIMPGKYDISSGLSLDTSFVDIVGFGSIKKDRGCVPAVTVYGGTLSITVDNVRIVGIEGAFFFSTSNSNIIIENCKYLNNDPYGFLCSGSNLSATFINCEAGDNSFYSDTSVIDGTFINCVAGEYGFGYYTPTITGKFINCEGGPSSFGGSGGTVNGEFINCEGAAYSFGDMYSTVNGVFIGCTGGDYSFNGGSGIFSEGVFDKCVAGYGSFNSQGPDMGASGSQLFYCRTPGSFNPYSDLVFCVTGTTAITQQ